MARAVYAQTDIILLDDPVSALDVNVRKRIFEQVFQGLLKGKTRILCTHAVEFLHLADTVIVMKGGRVHVKGTFKEVVGNPMVQEILKTSLKSEMQVSVEEATNHRYTAEDSDQKLIDFCHGKVMGSIMEDTFTEKKTLHNQTLWRAFNFTGGKVFWLCTLLVLGVIQFQDWHIQLQQRNISSSAVSQ